ncbi:endonuclease/exonuclease/phosphatase family metal-dependent hydrolase [Rubricella aquisinus]|uniref:Endonuclease/exonuclease/phosphatase family metal-dependent hydrolase n=1 Tax=Rubricella aquisinus TaxID=2028108 RepID=A0A840WPZ3_9RHOB|nr:endonuclease/exonuclease/phosphatase family protein [Rubricella aquisinus]MBB5516133.1 endonuclease/exonuclease/phosphatase family metal-dependent hydrolase [Rubricella aquisinus]
MRLWLKICALVGLLSACASETPLPPPPAPDTLRIGTYNVHYIILGRAAGAWSVGDWERRKGPLDQAFKALQADIIAFQEMESFGGGSGGDVNLTLDWLLAQNPGYAAAAVGDPRSFPSTQPILYRADRVRVRDQGWFFFSDTPDVIYSRTFNGSFPAFASWVTFEQDGKQPFTVYNVHYEFKSWSNRRLSADLVVRRMAPLMEAGAPVFLVGDLNARAGDEAVDIHEAAGMTFSPVEGSTYHFNRGFNLFGAIDHIAYAGGIVPVGAPMVMRRQFDGEWPTDHYPVIADFRVPDLIPASQE